MMINILSRRRVARHRTRRRITHSPWALSFLLVSLLILPALRAPLVKAAQGGWHVETVDLAGDVGRYTSLALDSDRHVHIGYFDSSGGDLRYAYWDAPHWRIESVDGGVYASLALDGDGYPHVSYCKGTEPDYALRYAYRDAAGWRLQTVDSDVESCWYTSVALDGDGYAHISYYAGFADSDLRYAYRDAAGWHIETVDSAGAVGQHSALALDEEGCPHISYYDGSHSALKYAYRDASGWHAATVDDNGLVGLHTSLALDGNGYGHISYYDATNKDLKVAYQDVTGWHVATVDSEGQVGQYTSLALDAGGYAHVGYYADYPDHDLKYAYQEGSGWHIETVDSTGQVGRYASLALDGAGYPHLSYYDASNTNLKYATAAPWLNWSDDLDNLLLPPRGATVGMVYESVPLPATLTATLSGPALFAGGSQELAVDITNPDGSHAFRLKPAAGAALGDVFTLEVTLAGQRLRRVGAIAQELYLPLIYRETL